jgi:hypothetical protein
MLTEVTIIGTISKSPYQSLYVYLLLAALEELIVSEWMAFFVL